MRKSMIMLHCSATREDQSYPFERCREGHIARGFRDIGYHYYIAKDGTVTKGRDEEEIGAHCTGYNTTALGVCYEGGLSSLGKIKDTRTEAQKRSILRLLTELISRHPISTICGHRDISPDTNDNGVIESFEWMKGCPCFDAKGEYEGLL